MAAISSRLLAARRSVIHLPKRSSSLQHQTEVVSEYNKYQNHANDIPVLVLPHSAKRAYKVHSTLRTRKPLDKASWLTKTLYEFDLPNQVKQDAPAINSDQRDTFQELLWLTVGAQKQNKDATGRRRTKNDIVLGLLLDSLRIALSSGESEHLKTSFLDHLPIVQTHWFRNFLFFHTETQNRPDYVLRTRERLSPIQSAEDAVIPDPSTLPGPYNTHSLASFLSPFVTLNNNPGYHNAVHNPVRYPHTTLLAMDMGVSAEELQSTAIMSSFIQLHSYALSTGHLPGTVMKKPLVTNCIVTNGTDMVFGLYQLNTLSMLDDLGIWNKMWITPSMALFQPQAGQCRGGLHESAESGDLLGHDPDCVDYLMTLLHRCTAPSLT